MLANYLQVICTQFLGSVPHEPIPLALLQIVCRYRKKLVFLESLKDPFWLAAFNLITQNVQVRGEKLAEFEILEAVNFVTVKLESGSYLLLSFDCFLMTGSVLKVGEKIMKFFFPK